MYVQSANDYIVQAVQGTGSSTGNVRGNTSDGITVEDTVTISSEALAASAKDDLEDISFKDYLAAYSDMENNSFWASLESKVKPSYFTGADEYNINVETQAAEQLVSEAAGRGYDLDLDEARVSIERRLGVDWANATDEAYEMGLLDGLKLPAINPYEYLTDEDRAILENMYNDAVANGLDTEQVDWTAQILGMTRLLNENSTDPDAFEFDTEFIAQLIEGVEERGHEMLDSETLNYFMDNFDSYSVSTV